jgi:hypothetical protein
LARNSGKGEEEERTYSAEVEVRRKADLDGAVGLLTAHFRAVVEEVEHRARVDTSQDEGDRDPNYRDVIKPSQLHSRMRRTVARGLVKVRKDSDDSYDGGRGAC